MNVKIGPYLNWWGPYQILGLLTHLGVSKETTDRWSEKTPGWITQMCEWIHRRRKRSVKVKIHPYDVWSMDSTLALIVLPMLRILKKDKQGAPGAMPAFDQTSNSAQSSFEFYAEGDEEAWRIGQQQWDAILDEIIWTFEQLQPETDWESQYWKTLPEMDLKKYPEDEGELTVPLRWEHEGECDWVGLHAHETRIQSGLQLFGTYFQSFWD